ncbi:hypothetical protein HanIR_Chr06g0279361 [Helianthus annuus]|nr:hypothetical protein HanIR_Chr06g0279361 [Helianthus annuus]
MVAVGGGCCGGLVVAVRVGCEREMIVRECVSMCRVCVYIYIYI